MKPLQDKIVAGAATVIAVALGFIWNTVNDSKTRLVELGVKNHITEMNSADTEREVRSISEKLHKAELAIERLSR